MITPKTGARIVGALACAWLSIAVSVAQAADATAAALGFAQKNKKELGLTRSDINDLVVSSKVVSKHTGVTHVYLQQRYRGIEIFNAIINVNVAADGSILSAGTSSVSNVAAAAGGQQARKSGVEAAEAAAKHLKLKATQPFVVLQRKGGPNDKMTLSDGGISAKPIGAKLVWLPYGGTLRLAWSVEIEQQSGTHWWYAFIDAETGESLGQQDLVVHDSIEATASAIARLSGVTSEAIASFPATDGASYRVFPIPLESPTDGGRELVTNAASPGASPLGWHDTNGAAGAEFTVTRGNNVHAYTDIDANNIADPLSDPDGGPGLLFDFPLDLTTQNPPDYRPAAVTNLFYWNNVMHDVTHGYGFDSASGNFQVNTYGAGGVGNDDVRAEAQDGSGTNNANFGTGVDGVRPRMQMFVWTHPTPNIVTVNSPGGIAGDYAASGAVFGPTFTSTGPITGNVIYVGRGCDPAYGGAVPLDLYLANPAGEIALVDRGVCTFTSKVKKAQDLGARAVIVANNAAGSPITLGGVDATITIPTLMVSLDNGNLFKANLPVNATLHANPLTSINRDSDLDAGVIAHEYGHGISNRLTGGPATASCLGNAEQMGEGWSDWFALTLTTHPSDRPTTRRGVGSYLIYQAADGNGIRPTPYTTDIGVNPSTYASVADVVNISLPHGIGYVWNTMLWEVYWSLVDRYGYNANVYQSWSTGGNNLALQLVMDGLKGQPCQPGFVTGRNAILAADTALTGGKNQCEIWRSFAKRGLGFSANQGSSSSRIDGVEAFDLPASCLATFTGFRPPILAAPTINSWVAGEAVSVKFTLDPPSFNKMQLDSQPVDCTTLEITGEAPETISTPGNSSVKNKKNIEFHVNWATKTAWAGSCRRLTLRIPAASDAVAYFGFN